MLEVHELAALRGDRLLFAGLDFSLDDGELLHVRGHNGSGKTTLLRMLTGLVTPSEGSVHWRGEDIRRHREVFNGELFYFGHLPALKDELNAIENLRTASHLAGQRVGREDAIDALDRMGLAGFEDLPARLLSQGQRRRVALARLLLTQARLWVLDEPFTALDVAAVDDLRETLRSHLTGGGMVVLTTHQEVVVNDVVVREIGLGR